MSVRSSWLLALALGLSVGACGMFSKKKEEKKPEPKPAPAGTSDWDQRIGQTGAGGHSDRIGAASIDTLAMGGPATSPKVADHLIDPSARVRNKAVEVLAKWGKESEPAVPKILEHLRNVDVNIRASAAKALAYIGSKSAADGLERALKDKDPRVRVWAHAGLVRIEGDCEDHMEEIAGILGGGHAISDAAEAMSRMKCPNPKAIGILIKALDKGEDDTRVAAARAIAGIGPKASAAVPSLMGALGDEKNFRVRHAALLGLAAMGPKAAPAVPMLSDMLRDRAPKFRELAARALGAVGLAARPAVDRLKKLTTDPEATVQAAARRALGRILREGGTGGGG